MASLKIKSVRNKENETKDEVVIEEMKTEKPVVNGGLKGILELLTKFVTVGGDFA